MFEESKFFDKIAEKYAESPVRNQAGYADTLSRIRKYLNPSSRVLEVGCGTGSTALALADDVEHIVSTDIAPKMVEIAKGKATAAGTKNVDFAVSSVLNTPGAPSSYDAVLALNLFHLVPDVPAAITALRAKLKPNGLLISKSVGVGGSFIFGVVIPVMQFFRQFPPVNYFTLDELSKNFTDAGFDIVESHDYDESPKRRFIVAKKIGE